MACQDEDLLAELKTFKDQVLYLLEKYPNTRDNDFYLQWLWLKIFRRLPLPFLDYKLIQGISGGMESVRRVRQKIQNDPDHPCFLPTDPDVRLKRGIKEETFRRVIHHL